MVAVQVLGTPPLSGTVEEHAFQPAGEPVWVRFELEDEKSWVGAFGSGQARASGDVGAATLEYPPVAYVVAGSRDYLINYQTHELLLWFDQSRSEGVLAVQAQDRFVLWDSTRLQAVDAKGNALWLSRRVSWDGLRDVHCDEGVIKGEAWSPLGGGWMGFQLDPMTGEFTGGSYVSGPWDADDQHE